jgi:hypothetical protein
MNTKTIIILFVIFLAVSFLAALPFLQEKAGVTERLAKNAELSFEAINQDLASTVTIRKNNNEFVLKKDSDGWKVASFSAHQPFVDAFFSALKESKAGSVVSRNEMHSSEYGVASESGIFVSLVDQTFIVGNDGPEAGSFYAKKEGSSNVYLVKGPLKDAIKTHVDDWRNKAVINISPENVNSIDVSGLQGFILKKKDNTWELTARGKTKELEEKKMSSILLRFSPLEGREFLNEQEQKQFISQKTEKIIIKDKDENVLAEALFLEKDGDYWMKNSSGGDTLKVSGYKLQEFFNLASS